MFNSLKSLTAHPAVLLGGSLLALASVWRLAPHMPVAHLGEAWKGAAGGTESFRAAFAGLVGMAVQRQPAAAPLPGTLEGLADGPLYQPDELAWHHWMS